MGGLQFKLKDCPDDSPTVPQYFYVHNRAKISETRMRTKALAETNDQIRQLTYIHTYIPMEFKLKIAIIL